jgi:BRCT domain type II-containing protein
MQLNQIREHMVYAGYIDESELIDLIKKYPNDADLGYQLRKLHYQKQEQEEKKPFPEACCTNHYDDEINCC